jgi:RHS repeat-associated protein
MVWNGRARRGLTQVASMVVVAGLLTAGLVAADVVAPQAGSVASAAQSPTDPVGAPLICGGTGSVFNDRTASNSGTYAKVRLSPNQRLTLTESGSVRPTSQIGATYQYLVQLEAWLIAPDGQTVVRDRWYIGHQQGGLPTNAIVNFSGSVVSNYVLPAGWGEGEYFIKTGLYSGGGIGSGNLGSELQWKVDVSVGDDPATGDVDDGPDCLPRESAESDTSNASEPNACGAQPSGLDPVNVVQGNFWQSWTDVGVAGRGAGISAARTYSSSRAATSGPLGNGWSWSYGMKVAVSSGVARVYQENGAVVPFSTTSAGWVPPKRVNATLVQNPGSAPAHWVFTRAGGEVFTFDSDGLLRSIADLSGNTTTLAYASGRLVTVTDPAARALTLTWDTVNNRITKLTAPSAQLASGGAAQVIEVTYGYTGSDLTSVTMPDGGVWTNSYDGSHRMTTIREPRHHALGTSAPVVENHYDAQGRVDWQEDRLDRRSTLDWSVANQTTVTDPKGNVVRYEHANGLCTAIVRDPGVDESRWTFEVDSATLGRTKVTDPNGAVTTAVFNGRGLPTKVVSPRGTTEITYDPTTMLATSVKDPSNVTTTFTYDAGTDRLRTVSRPVSPGTGTWSVALAYTDPTNPGMPTTFTDERGKVTTLEYRAEGDLAEVTDPTGEITTWAYNALGWPLSSVAPAGNAAGGIPAQHQTSWTYDKPGRVVAVTDPLGAVTSYGRDLSGLVTSVTDPVASGPAETTGLTWNPAGELTVVTRPDTSTLETSYWPDGSLKTQKDGTGVVTAYAYDGQGRLTSITDPASRATGFGYDAGGRLTWRQQPGGDCDAASKVDCISYSYLPSGYLGGVDYSDASTADVTFGYDSLGRRTSMVDQDGSSSWGWDSVGRLLSASDPAGGPVSYSYYGASNLRASVTYPGGKVVTEGVDDAGRTTTVTPWTGGAVTFGYDHNSNSTTVDTGATTGVEDSFDYDRLNAMTGYTLRQGATIRGTLGWTRDPEGMVDTATGTGTSTAFPAGADSFTYTGLDQLKTDAVGTYLYDPADNLTGFPDGRRQRFNAASELCYQASSNSAACDAAPADATTFTYDGRGNRETSIDPNGFGKVHTYDQADRLATVEVGTASVAPLSLMDGQPIPGDYDGDAKDDVFWYKPGAAADLLTWGSSRASFGKEASTPANVSGTYQPAGGDFNGDGHGDILFYAPGASADSIRFWYGRGDGEYDSQVHSISGTYQVVVGNFDGDAYDDVFLYLAGSGADTIWWGRADVNDGHSFDVTHPDVTGSGYEPVAGDFDGNGADDVFWYGPGALADPLWWFSATTRGSYSASTRTVAGAFTTVAGDFNGDDEDDLVFYSSSASDSLWWGNTTRTQFDTATQSALTITGTYTPTAGDFDGDGKDDLFLYGPGAGYDTMWWGTSPSSSFSSAESSGLPAPDPSWTYTYAGDGLRRTKAGTDGTTSTYTWDRSRGLPLLLAETINAPGTTNDRVIRYVYDPQGLVLADVTTPAGGPDTLRWFHHDQLGSTRALTDTAGTTLATFTYTPFGDLEQSTGTATTPMGWAGEYADAETGYVYLRARHYDPATAQFLTRDPAEVVTRSAYGYAHNNPTNFIDPTGLYGIPSGLPTLGDLWHGLTDQIGCEFAHAVGGVGDILSDHPELVHFAVNVVVGSLAGTLAAGICAGTLGAGCVIFGGLAISTGLGTVAHIGTAVALGEEVTLAKSGQWAASSAWAGGSGGLARAAWGRGLATGGPLRAMAGSPGLRGLFAQPFWGL